MKILITALIFLLFFSIIYIDFTIKKVIKEAQSNKSNYKTEKALRTLKNKEKHTKIKIQKAQQHLDSNKLT